MYTAYSSTQKYEVKNYQKELSLKIRDWGSVYIEKGEYEKSIKLVELIKDDYDKLELLGDIAKKCPMVEQDNKIFNKLQSIKNSPKQTNNETMIIKTLSYMADKYIRNNQKDKVLDILTKILKEAEPLYQNYYGTNSLVSVLTDVADKYIEIGEKSKALDILSQCIYQLTRMRNSLQESNQLANIGVKYIKMGHKTDKKTKKMLNEIIGTICQYSF